MNLSTLFGAERKQQTVQGSAGITFDAPPLMFAAWPGMGDVGLIAIDTLRRQTGARVFAGIDMSDLFVPETIVVESGIARLPEAPNSIFHYREHPNLVVFESSGQVGGKEATALSRGLLEIAEQLGVSRLYTAAAFARTMSHTDNSEVFFAGSNQQVKNELESKGVTAMPDGQISGLNGLVLGYAAARGLEAACLLGCIPSYAGGIAYPKASLEILRTLAGLTGLSLDLTELEQFVESTDQQLDEIEERIRAIFPSTLENDLLPPEDQELSGMEHGEAPKYIMDKIERLFQEVRRDKSRAGQLKDELVRWNLYDLYEDRFLNMFKDDNQQ